jgi:membrane protease YdiL (CAAX protease family)
MRKSLLEGSSPFTMLVFTAFAMIACALLFMFIGLLFAPLVVGIPLPEIITLTANGDMINHIALLRYMQTLQGITLFIIPAFFLGYLFSANVVAYFALRKLFPIRWLLFAFFVLVTAIPFINMLAALNELIVFPKSLSWLESTFRATEDNAREITERFLDVSNIGGLMCNIFMIALIPAIGEELIFRGILQKIFVRWTGNVHAAIIISAFLFSAMHLQFYGLFPRWLLGVGFGYLLVWSGSIWLPIFAHFVNNAMAVIVMYLSNKGHLPEKISDYGATWDAIPITIAMTAVCILLLWKLYQETHQKSVSSVG